MRFFPKLNSKNTEMLLYFMGINGVDAYDFQYVTYYLSLPLRLGIRITNYWATAAITI